MNLFHLADPLWSSFWLFIQTAINPVTYWVAYPLLYYQLHVVYQSWFTLLTNNDTVQ